MIFAISHELLAFLGVFLVWNFGFGVTFLGLYHGSSGFKNTGQIFLTLFDASLNSFSFEDLLYDQEYGVLGTSILVVYLCLSSVLLLNLLIARMSAIHDTVSENSLREWSYLKVKINAYYSFYAKRRIGL